MKRIFIPLAFILALLLSACGNSESVSDKNGDTDEVPTVEEMLDMPDVELASVFSGVELTERDGTFSIEPAAYENWEPVVEEGYDEVKAPYEYIGVVYAAYGEADINELALCMTKRFIHNLMNPEAPTHTSFLITAYKDLSVEVYTADELPEKYQRCVEAEPSDSPYTTWYVVPAVSYQFEGDVEGAAAGDWVTDLGGDYCLYLRAYRGTESENYSIGVARPAE